MDNLQLTHTPLMKTGMLIRRPVAEVFEAFIDPEITTQFWFTRSSGKLAPGAKVEWAWEMYDVSASVTVKAIEPNRHIVIQWPGCGCSRRTPMTPRSSLSPRPASAVTEIPWCNR